MLPFTKCSDIFETGSRKLSAESAWACSKTTDFSANQRFFRRDSFRLVWAPREKTAERNKGERLGAGLSPTNLTHRSAYGVREIWLWRHSISLAKFLDQEFHQFNAGSLPNDILWLRFDYKRLIKSPTAFQWVWEAVSVKTDLCWRSNIELWLLW